MVELFKHILHLDFEWLFQNYSDVVYIILFLVIFICKARESGNVGIYRANGSAHTLLINKILAKVDRDSILWEAPIKAQQVWFLKLLGQNVNLGNISYDDVIPLETLRLGLRGDTFFSHLPAELKQSNE